MLTQDRNWDNIAFFNPSWQEPKHDVCTSSSSTNQFNSWYMLS